MKYPPEIIEQVRASVDIVEYISQYVQLKKRGKNYTGLCPFRQEKTPSFSVSAEKQMFYCFGCSKGGSIFQFLEEYEKLTFQESVQRLAERAGIHLPKSYNVESSSSESDEMYEILNRAARIYHDQLVHSKEGEVALNYLKGRQFSTDIIRKFGLGYSPKGWDFLAKKFAEEQISIPLAEKAGLLRKRDEGSAYDYYRGRVMFPIFSTMGKVIGFGARKIYDDDTIAGKYINSPETPVYSKSKILYGLNFSKDAIREQENAILVEGYADCISLFQAGIENVVASSGTALTLEQVQLLSRYTKRITIFYDADTAGSNAALRGMDLVLQQNLDVRIVQLPEGDDPDSFVRKNGREEVERKIASAISFIEFVVESFQQQGKLATPEGLTEAVRSIVDTISKIPDAIKREMFIKSVAERYDIRESTLLLELERLTSKNQPREQRTVERSETATPRAAANQRSTSPELIDAERNLLKVMLGGDSELLNYVISKTPVEILGSTASELFQLLHNQFVETGEINAHVLLDEMEEGKTREALYGLLFEKHKVESNWEATGREITEPDLGRMGVEAIVHLHKKLLNEERSQLGQTLKLARSEEAGIAMNRMKEIQMQLQQLDEELEAYKNRR